MYSFCLSPPTPDFQTLLSKCGEEPGSKHLTSSQESAYCEAFRAFLSGSSSKWKPHHLESVACESHILKLRAQELRRLKALAPPSVRLPQSPVAHVHQPQQLQFEFFDFELFKDGMFSKKWKPQKGTFHNGTLWTGSSVESIIRRIQACSSEKDKQHNFICIDCECEKELTAHNGRDYTLTFKTQTDAKDHKFAFVSAAAADKYLEAFESATDVTKFDFEKHYVTEGASSSGGVSFSVVLDSFDITLRESQDLNGDWAKLSIVGAKFCAEIDEESRTQVKFDIQNLIGFLNQGSSSYLFLSTCPSQASSAVTFISAVYIQSTELNSLVVDFPSITDICLDKSLQDFLHSWWEFTNSDKSEGNGSRRPLISSSASSSAAEAESDIAAMSNAGPRTASSLPLDIHVTVNAPRCIFSSGNQALIIRWGKFQLKSGQPQSMQLARDFSLESSFHLKAEGYNLTLVALSDASRRPDCTTNFDAKSNLLTTIIPSCPFDLGMAFPDDNAVKAGLIPSFELTFPEPLHMNLDPAFVKFIFQEILPIVNKLSFQGAVIAEYLLKSFSDNEDMLYDLTHEQQTEMLLKLHQVRHPKYEIIRAQYELVRDSAESKKIEDFCQKLGRAHQSITQHEARYSFAVSFNQHLDLILKMSDDPSDPRAVTCCIKSTSKIVPILVKTLGTKIDAVLTQGWGLDCSISTVDVEGETDFIWMDALVSSANFSIQDLATSISLELSSRIIRASLSPQQVYFFTKLIRDFQATMVGSGVQQDPSAGDHQAADASVLARDESDDAAGGTLATKTTRMNVTVHLTNVEVGLKLDVREAKQKLMLLCEEIDVGMDSEAQESADQPLRQVRNINLSLKRIKARSFCSNEEGLELLHSPAILGATLDNPDHALHHFFSVQMTQEQQQVEVSSTKFNSKNVISVESKRPIIFVIDARSICTLLQLATKLGDAAGNPEICLTNSYEIAFSFPNLSLDLIISAEKHFRLSLCLPGSESANRVISSPGAHKSDQSLFVGNVMFGVVLIHSDDLHAATYQSLIIDDVSFSIKFEIGEHVLKNAVSVRTHGGIVSKISYQVSRVVLRVHCRLRLVAASDARIRTCSSWTCLLNILNVAFASAGKT